MKSNQIKGEVPEMEIKKRGRGRPEKDKKKASFTVTIYKEDLPRVREFCKQLYN